MSLRARLARALRRTLASAVGSGLVLLVRFLTAARVNWDGIEPVPRQRVYFANHSSNADFPLIWTVLPPPLRRRTRPVAASDYWLKSKLRAFMIIDVFNAVPINRDAAHRDPDEDPVARMLAALNAGDSLIIFPEGGRNMGPEKALPFKSGLYHLAKARPDVDLVPVWVENINSLLPKGEVIPLPVIVTVTFGAPIHLTPGESKDAFLARAREALIALSAGNRPDEPEPAP